MFAGIAGRISALQFNDDAVIESVVPCVGIGVT